jgi:hypothetical protein
MATLSKMSVPETNPESPKSTAQRFASGVFNRSSIPLGRRSDTTLENKVDISAHSLISLTIAEEI